MKTWIGFGLAGMALLAVSVPGQTSAAPSGQDGRGSAVRSARMSFATGGVSIGQAGDTETWAAQMNMPLAQGSRVTTQEKGQAEVEFEDGSVARMAPNSALSLEYLATDSDGQGTITVLRVVKGLVYLEMRAAGVSRFRVIAGGDTIWPVENATVRVSLDDPPAVIAVLDGRVRVEHTVTMGDSVGPQAIQGYRTDVRGGESLRDDAGDAARYFLSEGVAPETWDQWNEARDQAAADQTGSQTGVREGFAGTQGYGWSDLDASGTWYAGDGQAPVWQPSDALAAGFDPYGYGSWSYYPGAGYTWASSYAWGWTPYRCGRWDYWQGFGWGWQPDSFCGTRWSFGGGVNVYGPPRGYVVPGVPIKRPGGVHPILPGRHSGERPPTVDVATGGGERRIAEVLLRPIKPAGAGYTARGGSAIGSALRRDFPVDAATHGAVLGTASSGPGARQPVSAAPGWRSVSTRPEPVEHGSGGGLRGLFGHGPRTADGSVRVDGKGNPYSVPVRGSASSGSMTHPAASASPASHPGTSTGSSYRGQGGAVNQGAVHSQAAASSHASPPSAPAAHSAPAASPAALPGHK